LIRSRLAEVGVEDQLAGLEARRMPAEELEQLQYVVGRDYDSISTYEVDVGDADDEVPYFRCVASGVEYSSEQMGQGELSAHLLLWRLRNVEAGSVVLVEEPETYLAPRSQVALVDVVAALARKRNLIVIFSTHSEGILRRVPVTAVRVVQRSQGKVLVDLVSSRSAYLSSIGVSLAARGVLLVEDKVAAILARELLRRFDRNLAAEVAVEVVATGESGLRSIAEQWPCAWLPVIALFDGDQRGRGPAGTFSHAYLPGSDSPEQWIKRLITRDPPGVAACLRAEVADVDRALGAAEGLNHHEWLNAVCDRVGADQASLIRATIDRWHQDASVGEQMAGSVREIVAALRHRAEGQASRR
jgi:energy-coupling factor transporter ATP-binding protein EcfA2